MSDPVEKPAHYNAYPGVEVIDLTKHMNFCLGNVVKYCARADFKGKPLEDLRKAAQYLAIEIARREALDAAVKPEPVLAPIYIRCGGCQ